MIKMQKLKSRKEWLEARKSYIGGSDAACILGMNPWRSNVELWEIKKGLKELEDISEKPVVKYGTLAEEHLREIFRLDFPQYKVEYAENNIWTNTRYPWAEASLDGWLTDQDGRMGILEIKTSTINSAAAGEKWKGQIPDNYYLQLLHYMAVTGAGFAILKAQLTYRQGEEVMHVTRHYDINREDVEDDIIILMEEEKKFAESLKGDTAPALILPEI